MKKSNHTAAPWKANIESAEGTTVELSDGRQFYISSEGQDTDTVHANARLIAAAPELLSALEKALPVLESLSDDAVGYFSGREFLKNDIRKLINKAKGIDQ